MYKKYVILMFLGISIVALSLSATAEEEKPINRIVSREVNSEDGVINEPLIEEVSNDEKNEDLIIAPNPEETIEHDSSKGEKEYQNVVGEDCNQDSPHILDMGNNKESLDASFSAKTDTTDLEQKDLSILLIIGAIGAIGILLIIVRKKK